MTWLPDITKKLKLSPVELIFIIIILVFGSFMVVTTPLGAGFDEDQHFYRVWQISKGILVPREMGAQSARFPQVLINLSHRKQPIIEAVGLDFWEKYGRLRLFDQGIRYGSLKTRSNYSPFLYFPQAFVVRYLGVIGNYSALLVYYASRFAGLLSYMFLALIAIRLIPYGKWIFLVLSLTPMAIFQAATISADTISNGIGLAFIGGALYVQEKQEVSWKNGLLLVTLIALLFSTKPNLFPLVIIPFLTIRPSRFPNKFGYPALIFVTLILFMVEAVGWWRATSSNMDLVDSGSVNAAEQISNIFSNPLVFLQVLRHSVMVEGPRYLYQWIGVYGYDFGRVPVFTHIFFWVSLVLAFLFVKEQSVPGRNVRIVLITAFIATYVATILSLYVTFTAVGETFVYGIQGRYFIPVFPLLFLGLVSLFPFKQFASARTLAVIFLVASSLSYASGLILNYHVTCGTSYFIRGLCYQPVYKNFAPLEVSSPPVSKDMTFIQEIVPVCDGMTMIQVRFNSPGNDKDGSVQISLLDVKPDKIVVEEVVKNSALPTDDWYSMYFNPDWESANKPFKLTIQGIDTEPHAAPLLAYSIRPEYSSGTLLVNGAAIEDDVIFRYGCVAGIDKLFDKTTLDPNLPIRE